MEGRVLARGRARWFFAGHLVVTAASLLLLLALGALDVNVEDRPGVGAAGGHACPLRPGGLDHGPVAGLVPPHAWGRGAVGAAARSDGLGLGPDRAGDW